MYRVLIVDDEAMIRTGIKTIMPWKKLGVEQVLLAASGERAVEQLADNSVDLMITDICMINMDGLELIAKVNECHPDMRIIVLTGYSSFEYSQQCCRMNVHDFLLKPIDETELETAIAKQLDILKNRRMQQKQNRTLSRAHGLTEQNQLETEMRRILEGRFVEGQSTQQVLQKLSYNPTPLLQVFVLLPALVEADDKTQDMTEFVNLTAKSLCISMFDAQDQGITFDDSQGRMVVAGFVAPEYDSLENRVKELHLLLLQELRHNFTILIGSRVEGLKSIHISYNDALLRLAIAQETYPQVFQSEKEELRKKSYLRTIRAVTSHLLDAVQDKEAFCKALEKYNKCVQEYSLENATARRTSFEIVSALYYQKLLDTGESADDSFIHFFNSIRSCNVKESCQLMQEYLLQLFFSSDHSHHELVRDVMRYINDNLACDLSVSSLATSHYFTINHLSRLFKRETGEGCNEYIVRKRMEKAMGLLQSTTMKSGQIAIAVGYKDINYFSLSFKKFTGSSPTEYREQSRHHETSMR